MNALIYLIGTTLMYFIGYYIGNQQGRKDGIVKGFDAGFKVALHEVDRNTTEDLPEEE